MNATALRLQYEDNKSALSIRINLLKMRIQEHQSISLREKF